MLGIPTIKSNLTAAGAMYEAFQTLSNLMSKTRLRLFYLHFTDGTRRHKEMSNLVLLTELMRDEYNWFSAARSPGLGPRLGKLSELMGWVPEASRSRNWELRVRLHRVCWGCGCEAADQRYTSQGHLVRALPHCGVQPVLFTLQVRTGYVRVLLNMVISVTSTVHILHPSSP